MAGPLVGSSDSGWGVWGSTINGTGVAGTAGTGVGTFGESSSSYGVGQKQHRRRRGRRHPRYR